MSKLLPLLAMPLALFAEAASAQGFSVNTVRFDGGAPQDMRFRSAKAVAYDAEGKPLFQGTRDFVLGFAGNSAGRIWVWDLGRRQVRISAPDRPPVWLACADLQPMAFACSATLRLTSDGDLVVGGGADRPSRGSGDEEAPGPAMGRLPDCPGDPRCPGG